MRTPLFGHENNFVTSNKIIMSNVKCLGIWTDHSNAHLIEFNNEPTQQKQWILNLLTKKKKKVLEKASS